MAKSHLSSERDLFQCKGCERHLDADAFYASNLSRCKECVKSRVRENRAEKIDYYRSYDRLRYRQDPERKAHCIAMGKTVPLAARLESQRRRRAAEPEKDAARRAVAHALQSGKIVKPSGCFFCKKEARLQAHHPDYSRPLDVFWLCPKCHGKLHTVNGDFLRGDVR